MGRYISTATGGGTFDNSGLRRTQIKKLVAKLDPKHVHQRQIEGKTFPYIEGWFAIAEANAIFGFDGWDRETVALERVFEQNRFQDTQCAYTARVRIRVKAGERTVVREGSGFAEGFARSRSDAHERAIKAAETDATKRALATFGNRFGLSLYERDKAGTDALSAVLVQDGKATLFRLYGSPGDVVADQLSAEAFCSGLRQLIEQTNALSDLVTLEVANKPVLALLRATRKDLVSSRGTHFADILERLITTRKTALADPAEAASTNVARDNPRSEDCGQPGPSPQSDTNRTNALDQPEEPAATNTILERAAGMPLGVPSAAQGDFVAQGSCVAGQSNSDSSASATNQTVHQPKDNITAKLPTALTSPPLAQNRIDKSQLALGVERRIRSKAHLRFVSSKPCLICGELPTHAHHVTFAQPRGLSIKVSDEFTVPLCPIHHNLLHQSPNERAFWRQQGIDALQEAAKFWERSRRDGRTES